MAVRTKASESCTRHNLHIGSTTRCRLQGMLGREDVGMSSCDVGALAAPAWDFYVSQDGQDAPALVGLLDTGRVYESAPLTFV